MEVVLELRKSLLIVAVMNYNMTLRDMVVRNLVA